MYQDQQVNSNMVNLLRNNATALCNSIALSNSAIEKLKQYKPLEHQVKNNNGVFLLQQMAKAQLELLNLKRKCM